uniref:Uncharacterized protein n=1 Tax=Anser cygnoides TaxID=8845 RepID=A0A8B9ELA7_ANSCY
MGWVPLPPVRCPEAPQLTARPSGGLTPTTPMAGGSRRGRPPPTTPCPLSPVPCPAPPGHAGCAAARPRRHHAPGLRGRAVCPGRAEAGGCRAGRVRAGAAAAGPAALREAPAVHGTRPPGLPASPPALGGSLHFGGPEGRASSPPAPCALSPAPPRQKHYFPIGYTLRVQYEEVLRPANITRLVRPPWGQSGDEAGVEAAAVVAVGWWLGFGGLGFGGLGFGVLGLVVGVWFLGFGGLGFWRFGGREATASPPASPVPQRAGAASEASLRYLWFHVSAQAVQRIREALPEQHPSWPYTRDLGQLLDALGREYGQYRQSDVAAAVAELVQRLHSGERRPKAVRPKALLDNCLRVLRMLFGAPCEWGRGFGGGPGC